MQQNDESSEINSIDVKETPVRQIADRYDPITIKINPRELRSSIVIPEVRYEIVPVLDNVEVFRGMVIPIPKILIFFLNQNELMVMALIIEETNLHGECKLSTQQIADRIKRTKDRVYKSLYTLRKLGLLIEWPNGKKGNSRNRVVNFDTLQHLNDLVEGEDMGVYARIRKKTRKVNIMRLTKEDIKSAYDHRVLDPDHDPVEEEEYD